MKNKAVEFGDARLPLRFWQMSDQFGYERNVDKFVKRITVSKEEAQ